MEYLEDFSHNINGSFDYIYRLENGKVTGGIYRESIFEFEEGKQGHNNYDEVPVWYTKIQDKAQKGCESIFRLGVSREELEVAVGDSLQVTDKLHWIKLNNELKTFNNKMDKKKNVSKAGLEKRVQAQVNER